MRILSFALMPNFHKPQTEAELAAVRRSVQRGCPLGSDAWQRKTAKRFDLEHTLRPRGRPKKPTVAGHNELRPL